jgi:hypothetical protein
MKPREPDLLPVNLRGAAKAENEITSAKRWLKGMGERRSSLSVTIMGDNINARSIITVLK